MGGGAPISILTSGVGLGVYIPSLLIRRQLRAAGVAADVEVLEGHFTPDGQRRHLAHKQAFHDRFDIALMAQRMARSVESSLDGPRVDALLGRWAVEGRRSFIVWSGFWLPILERYRSLAGGSLEIDCCRIDAVVSPSFRAQRALPPGAVEIWLWSWQDRKTVFEIPVDDRPQLPFADRDRRLVVHGGGWGVGTYRDALADMAETGWAFDVVVHDRAEAAGGRPPDRFFMVDPDWRAWHAGGGGEPTFPPFFAVGDPAPAPTAADHALYERIRRTRAIVSKPGGGTLIDSLASSTPVVLLDPLGDAEASNGALWEHLGFGVPYAKWRESGFSESVLAGLHANLARRARHGPAYPRDYIERLRRARA